MSSPGIIGTWTRRQFQNELRRAGWTMMSGSAGATYVSPDDSTVLFQMDRYRVGFGIMWEYFATRRELPATTRPPF